MNDPYRLKSLLGFGFAMIVAVMIQLQPAAAFEDEWRDSDHRRIETNTIYGSTLATAIGNQINVEAGPGSSVVINGNQYNYGHQLAVTVIGEDQDDIAKEAIEDFHDRN